jgi:hypothetical protein
MYRAGGTCCDNRPATQAFTLIYSWLHKSSLQSLYYTQYRLSLQTPSTKTACVSLSLSLMSWPTVSRPVCLGIKHPTGAYDQIFISVRNTEYVWQLRSCFRGAPSLTRGRVCLL